MSGFITHSTALAIICRTVAPTPIGQTPGFLSRVISWQAKRGEMDFRSTCEVQILLATRAKENDRSLEAPLRDVLVYYIVLMCSKLRYTCHHVPVLPICAKFC